MTELIRSTVRTRFFNTVLAKQLIREAPTWM